MSYIFFQNIIVIYLRTTWIVIYSPKIINISNADILFIIDIRYYPDTWIILFYQLTVQSNADEESSKDNNANKITIYTLQSTIYFYIILLVHDDIYSIIMVNNIITIMDKKIEIYC